MSRPNRIVVAALLAAAGMFQSCCYEPVCPKPDPCSGATDRAWYLTKVEVDECNLNNTGSLPVYRRSDGYSFGQEPVAYGTMQSSRDGLWSITVRFRETVVGFSGRTGTHEYEVLTLAGKAKDKKGCHIMAQGAMPADVLVGVATEVWVEKVSATKLRVQPATREKRLPYKFTFDRAQVQPRPVSIPLL